MATTTTRATTTTATTMAITVRGVDGGGSEITDGSIPTPVT
jgi:hypothetical protein